MITFALDECGDFEEIDSANTDPVCIAGIMYDDNGNAKDTENERKRIAEFYKKCIAEANSESPDAGFVYPAALHSDGNAERNHNIVRLVKKRVNAGINEFLRLGTHNGSELLGTGKERNGKYYLFAFVKSDRGMSLFTNGNASFLVKDDQGSNLYFHMASEVVCRLVFHNPFITNLHSVSFDIATRKSKDFERTSSESLEYKRQGYKEIESERRNGRVYYDVANSDIYRTIISQEIIKSGKTNIEIKEFNVRPIRYSGNGRGMESLYLSDTLCSYLSNNNKDGDSALKFNKILSKLNVIHPGNDNIVFGYDEIDVMYEKAWEKYEAGDYYGALTLCFDSRLETGGFSDFYKKWFTHIENLIVNDSNEGRFARAVREVDRTVKTNKLNQERALYILSVLEKKIKYMEDVLDDIESRQSIYLLYRNCIILNCHIGNSKKANDYYNKCKKYAGRVGIEEYLDTLNQISELYLDLFEWSKARKINKESIEYNNALIDMKSKIPIFNTEQYSTSVGLNRAYSQLGQVYGFIRDPRCETYFLKALEGFGEESTEYYRTQSYLLHYYLDNGKEAEYLEASMQYFGGNISLKKQYEYILSEGFKETPLFDIKYALYVYVRGIYTFRMHEVTDEFVEGKLFKIEDKMAKAFKKSSRKGEESFKFIGHPTELIYKYIVLIAMAMGRDDLIDELNKKREKCVTNRGITLDYICMCCDMEILKASGDERAKDKAAEIIKFLKDNFSVFRNLDENTDTEEFFGKYLTYMYH